ncbi:unnamed protein product, partial [Closterium sp. NIES-54]
MHRVISFALAVFPLFCTSSSAFLLLYSPFPLAVPFPCFSFPSSPFPCSSLHPLAPSSRVFESTQHSFTSSLPFPLLLPAIPLLFRLAVYGLRELPMVGDGNCQFRALADQLFRNANRHAAVRQAVVQQMRAHSERYSPYVPDSFPRYLRHMA